MYHMRGNRVSPMQEEEIAYKAINFCNAFGIAATKRKRKRYDLLFEKLSTYGITLSVMDDKQWEFNI